MPELAVAPGGSTSANRGASELHCIHDIPAPQALDV
jgi:hypothetical protein